MAEYLSGRAILTKSLNFLSTNRMILLFMTLIGAQLLTWRAVVAVEDQVDSVWRAVYRTSCGVKDDVPCRVVIVNR